MNISTQQNAASAEELAASMAIFKKRHNIGRNPKKSGATAKSQIKALPQR